jgi:hypothetical protein
MPTFLHPLLLAGAAAGAIPIIIHLLNRQHFKRILWAAMHWLWASYKKQRRRLHLEQLILLAIRVLILVLLALALSRPLFEQGLSAVAGRAAAHRVIVIDNSYSMGQLVGGKPLFEKAKQLAHDLAEKAPLSDELDVVLANSTGEETLASPNTPRTETLNQIKAAGLSDGGSDIPKSIAAACRVLNDSRSRHRREIIVVTDQTRAGWEGPDRQPRRVSGDDEAAVSKAFSDSRGRPRILVARLAGEKECDNLAAVKVEIEEKVVPARVDTQFVGTIRCLGTAAADNVKVKLKVDGEEVASEQVSRVSPEKPATVSFYHSFAEPGSHTVGIELESPTLQSDVLPVDNSAFMALDVEDQMRVLCVDGQQRVGPNASELDFFRQALSPSKSEEVKAGRMPLLPEVISDSKLPEANLDNYRLVVLANVGAIPPEKVRALEDYVKRGGALWIFLGDRVDPALYNKELANLLPVVLGEVVGSTGADAQGDALMDAEAAHPAIAKLKGIKGLPLSQLRVFRRFRFLPSAQGDPAVRTVLTYENGDAAAAERTVGGHGGRVLLVGTTADKAWNNWPAKNQYMPLMNFLALYLIQPAHVERNRMVGERFALRLPRQDLGAARREGMRLVSPAGETTAMEVSTEQSMAESGTIRKAGVYVCEVPGERRRTMHFAANRNTDESDLAVIEDREILFNVHSDVTEKKERGGYFGGLVTQADLELPAPDVKALEDAARNAGGGRELWRWLVGAVMILLLAESLLAKRFGDFTRS